METKSRNTWGLAAIVMLVAGVIASVAVVAFVLANNSDEAGAQAPSPTPTATLHNETADEALAVFIRARFDEAYIGACPTSMPQELPEGICSVDISRSDNAVEVGLGHPFSEGIGKAVLTKHADGTWSIDFEEGTGAGAP